MSLIHVPPSACLADVCACRDDAAVLLRDRTFIEQMKADILRRAEEVSDSEEEEVANVGIKGKGKAPTRGQDIAFEDDADESGAVRVRDGNSSDDGSGGSDEEEDEEQAQVWHFPSIGTVIPNAGDCDQAGGRCSGC